MKVFDPQPRRPLSGWGIFALVGVLLCFGALNIAVRATWHKLEDGVLWEARPEGVVAAEVAARSTAMAAGIRAGDVLIAIDGAPVESPEAVDRALSQPHPGNELTYSVLRLGQHQMLNVKLAAAPGGTSALYFILAAIGIFTLLVGASVRLRRPHDAATLHFFWLCLAFFGTLTFSFSRLDRLDWYFYWADAIATLLLAPLFLHFTLVFPDRPSSWIRGEGQRFLPFLYAPAGVLGLTNVIAVGRLPLNPALYSRLLITLDQIEPLYLSVYMIAGLSVLTRAIGRVRSATGEAPASLDRMGHGVRRGPVCAGIRAAVCAGTQGVAADGAVGDSAQPGAAGLCVRDHPLPPDGRRSDREAQHGVCGRGARHLHHLRHAAAPGRHRVRCGGSAQHGHRHAGDDRRGAAVQPGEERDSERPRPRVLSRQIRLPPRARGLCARFEQRPRSRSPGRAARGAHSRDLRRRSHGAHAAR